MAWWIPLATSVLGGLASRSGGMGGRQTSKEQIPQWVTDQAQANIAQAQQVGQLGYVPYYGPEVAAMTPMQLAAGQGISSAAGAFGLPGGGMSPTQGMPQPQTFAGGVQGYSSGNVFEQALRNLQQNRPGQYQAMMDMFINPQTGQMPKPKPKPKDKPKAKSEPKNQSTGGKSSWEKGYYTQTQGGQSNLRGGR